MYNEPGNPRVDTTYVFVRIKHKPPGKKLDFNVKVTVEQRCMLDHSAGFNILFFKACTKIAAKKLETNEDDGYSLSQGISSNAAPEAEAWYVDQIRHAELYKDDFAEKLIDLTSSGEFKLQ